MISRNDKGYEITLPLSVVDIQQIIPHRYPFLYLDQVIEFSNRERIIGIKNVSINEPFFVGHFPDRPIMPGVLVLEALAQLGVIFAKLSSGGISPDGLMVFSGVDAVRFRRPVMPGDILRLEMSLLRSRIGYWKMQGAAKVGDEVAAEGVLMAMELR